MIDFDDLDDLDTLSGSGLYRVVAHDDGSYDLILYGIDKHELWFILDFFTDP